MLSCADADIWVKGSSMFVDDCPYSERGLGGFRCLSAIGWLFTIFFTYTGFALLIAGASRHLSAHTRSSFCTSSASACFGLDIILTQFAHSYSLPCKLHCTAADAALQNQRLALPVGVHSHFAQCNLHIGKQLPADIVMCPRTQGVPCSLVLNV